MSYQAATDLRAADARLPTAEEAAILAPMIGGPADGVNRAVWTTPTSSCDPSSSGYPTYANTALDQGTRCKQSGFFADLRAAAICVPETGPLPKPSQL